MAVAMAGNFALAFNSLGVIYRRLGDHERAFNAYVLAMNCWGMNRITANNLLLLYLRESGYEQGVRPPLPEELPEAADATDMVRIGHAWMARGKTRMAIQMYNRAMKLAPESVDPVLGKARAELVRKQPGVAMRSLSRVLALQPDHEAARHLVAHLKHQMSEVKPAKELVFKGDPMM